MFNLGGFEHAVKRCRGARPWAASGLASVFVHVP